MRNLRCHHLAELRSAFVDDALGGDDRERLLAHLAGCSSCRAEVDELRAVRTLLHQVGASGSDLGRSAELSSRLVSIAGPDAAVPVWSRPFRRTLAGTLPRSRRRTRVRAALVGLAVGGLTASLAGVGYLVAPAAELPTVVDPLGQASSEFAAVVGELPLTSRSLNALLVTPVGDLSPVLPQPQSTAVSAGSQPLTPTAAVSALRRAVDATDRVSHLGTQLVSVTAGSQRVSALVGVSFEPGQGSTLTVLNRRDGRRAPRFVPVSTAAASDGGAITRLLDSYDLTGWSGGTFLGRPVTIVRAHRDSDAGASTAAQWWVDDTTGLLLRSEAYDEAGTLTRAAGFTALQINSQPRFQEHLAPRLTPSTTTASLTLSHADDLATRGWSCPDRLAGLPLARLRSDAVVDPETLHIVYTDGVSTLSVFEQHGRLDTPPDGSRPDAALGGYVKEGAPSSATWRSGDRVITVVTDGSPDLVRRAAAALPHDPVSAPTTMDHVRAGWARILKALVG